MAEWVLAKMVAIVLLGLVSIVWARSDDCVLQCRNIYEGHSVSKGVFPACKRGCELYTLAFISSNSPVLKSKSFAKKRKGMMTSRATVEPTSQPVQEVPRHGSSATTYGPHKVRITLENSINTELDSEREPKQSNRHIFPSRDVQALETCKQACKLAGVTQAGEHTACEQGCFCGKERTCTSSVPQREEKSLRWTVIERTPLTDAEKPASNLAGRIGNLISVSWSSFSSQSHRRISLLDSSDDEMWSMQAAPGNRIFLQQRTQHKTLGDMFHLWKSMKKDFENSAMKLARQNIIGTHKLEGTSSDDTSLHKIAPNERAKLKTRYELIKKEKIHSQSQLDILECISRKSGLPRWFIGFTLFSSVPIAVWLCLSLVGASEEHEKLVKANLSEEASEKRKQIQNLDEKFISEKARLVEEEKTYVQIV